MTTTNLIEIFEAALDNANINGGAATTAADFEAYAANALDKPISTEAAEKMGAVAAVLAADSVSTSDDYYHALAPLRAAAEHITIAMSERRPLKFKPDEWPVIASARKHDGQVECQANNVWAIRVRENEDGRRIVYGSHTAGEGGQYAGFREARGGFLIDAPNAADCNNRVARERADAETVRAIRRVGGLIDADDLASECIGDLPAEEI